MSLIQGFESTWMRFPATKWITQSYMYMCIYIYTNIYIYIICIYIRICIHAYMYILYKYAVYIYIYICTHTHTYVYIHIYMKLVCESTWQPQKMYANVACCLAPLPRQARNFGPTAKTLLQEGGYWGISLQRDQTIHIVIPQAMIDTLW